jgi:hypothetical protein
MIMEVKEWKALNEQINWMKLTWVYNPMMKPQTITKAVVKRTEILLIIIGLPTQVRLILPSKLKPAH